MFCRIAQSTSRNALVPIIDTVPTNTPIRRVLIRTLAIN